MERPTLRIFRLSLSFQRLELSFGVPVSLSLSVQSSLKIFDYRRGIRKSVQGDLWFEKEKNASGQHVRNGATGRTKEEPTWAICSISRRRSNAMRGVEGDRLGSNKKNVKSVE